MHHAGCRSPPEASRIGIVKEVRFVVHICERMYTNLILVQMRLMLLSLLSRAKFPDHGDLLLIIFNFEHSRSNGGTRGNRCTDCWRWVSRSYGTASFGVALIISLSLIIFRFRRRQLCAPLRMA